MPDSTTRQPDRDRRLTLHDVARHCGLSKSTVSLALNTPPDSSPLVRETHARVVRAAHELGYRPNWRAKALVSGRSFAVGLLYRRGAPYMSQLNAEIYSAIAETLLQQGYHLLFIPVLEGAESWRDMVRDRRIDGALMVQDMPAPVVDVLTNAGLPTVTINTTGRGTTAQILPDDAAGAEQLTNHLLELGHRDIWFCLDPHRWRHHSVRTRMRSFVEHMNRAHATPRIIRRLHAEDVVQRWLNANPRPSAIMTWDHVLAVDLLHELWRRGVTVPDDVSVATFNDVYPVSRTIPPLTTVHLHADELGQQGANILLHHINNHDAQSPPNPLVRETLMIRQSTAPR